MKVILTSRIKNLGEVGEVKEVANGYGKNYLLPKKLAIPYSKGNLQFFEEKKAEILKLNEDKHNKALLNKDRIDKIEIVILENAGDNDKLYGSITPLRLANKINELADTEIAKSNVVLKNPIKELGEYTISIELDNDVIFDKEIFVVRSAEELKKLKAKKTAKKQEKENKEENKEKTENK